MNQESWWTVGVLVMVIAILVHQLARAWRVSHENFEQWVRYSNRWADAMAERDQAYLEVQRLQEELRTKGGTSNV